MIKKKAKFKRINSLKIWYLYPGMGHQYNCIVDGNLVANNNNHSERIINIIINI